MKKLPCSKQVDGPQPRNRGSWDLLGMCQWYQLPCGGAVTCSWGTWDTHLLSFGPWWPSRPISSRRTLRTLQDDQKLAPAWGNPMGWVGTETPTATGSSYSPNAAG